MKSLGQALSDIFNWLFYIVLLGALTIAGSIVAYILIVVAGFFGLLFPSLREKWSAYLENS